MTIIHACICYTKTKEALGWSKTEALEIQKRYADLKRQQTDSKSQPTNAAAKTTPLASSSKSNMTQSGTKSLNDHKLSTDKTLN